MMDVYHNRKPQGLKDCRGGRRGDRKSDGTRRFRTVYDLAEEGRIILGGNAEALYYGGESGGTGERNFLKNS